MKFKTRQLIYLSIVIFIIVLTGCKPKVVGISTLTPAVKQCAWVIEQPGDDYLYGFILEDGLLSVTGEGRELSNPNYWLFYGACKNKKVIHFDIDREEYTSRVKELYPRFFTETIDPETGEKTEIMGPPMLPNGSAWKTWYKDIVEELGLEAIDDLTVYKCSGEGKTPPSPEAINKLIEENKLETECEKI